MTQEKDTAFLNDVIAQYCEQFNLPHTAGREQVKALLKIISDNLTGGKEVNLTGFGAFKLTHRKERQGRNPKTGESILIPAQNGITFKAAKMLRDALNPASSAASTETKEKPKKEAKKTDGKKTDGKKKKSKDKK